ADYQGSFILLQEKLQQRIHQVGSRCRQWLALKLHYIFRRVGIKNISSFVGNNNSYGIYVPQLYDFPKAGCSQNG
nr:hypothetical protein [Tanacetum cinerariifolium]